MIFFRNLTITLILFFSLFIDSKALAQGSYEAGYIVNLQNDTLKGYIDNRKWDKNPLDIRFKTTLQSASVGYEINSLKAFGVANTHYVKATVSVDTSSTDISRLSYTPTPELKTETIFLLKLFDGAKGVFFYKDKNAREQFFIGNNGSYNLLIHKQYFITGRNNAKVIVENNEYADQLSAYLTNCPAVASEINKTTYTRSAIIKLFSNYYACTNEKFSAPDAANKVKLAFGVIAGASLTRFSASGKIPYFDLLNNAKSTNFAGGLTMDILLPGNNYRWSIVNELMYTSYTVAVHKTTYKSPDIYSDDNVRFGMSFIKLNNMLRVKFPINRASLFLNGGFANGVVISTVNNVKSISTFYSTTTTTDQLLAKQELVRKFESGFLFGLGAGFDRYTVQARGEISSSATDIGGESSTQKAYLLLTYKF